MDKRGKIAFIFFGNSTASAFDIGVSKVLFKKITPDFVLANSMGSVNASYILKDKNFLKNIKEGEKLWRITDTRKLFKINPKIFYKLIFAKSLFINKGLKKFLSEIAEFKNRKIEDSSLQLHIGAYNNTDDETVFFNRGNLLEAVMASCSAPFYFPPYKIDGKNYIDGGVNGRACLDKAIELGAKKIFLINVATPREKGRSLFGLTRKILHTMKKAPIEHLLDSKIKDILVNISPDQEFIPKKFTDMRKTESLIKHGEKKAREALKK